jgi:hypothetical protein
MNQLQQWVDQSPNRSTHNTLIQTVGLKKGKPVYYSYRWNLRPVEPNEPDVYTRPDGRIITPQQAHALL